MMKNKQEMKHYKYLKISCKAIFLKGIVLGFKKKEKLILD
jgi:hypothetical protein